MRDSVSRLYMRGSPCRNHLVLVRRLRFDIVHGVQERNDVTKACYGAAISKSALSWVLAMVLRSSQSVFTVNNQISLSLH
jgi:hypothetical protein